jgi:hypothetical protein
MEDLKGNWITRYALAMRQTLNYEYNPKKLKYIGIDINKMDKLSCIDANVYILHTTENPFSMN